MHLPASNDPERLFWNAASSGRSTAGQTILASASPKTRPKRMRSRSSPLDHQIADFLDVGFFHSVRVTSSNRRLVWQLLLETACERRCRVAVSGSIDRLCPPRPQLRYVDRWFWESTSDYVAPPFHRFEFYVSRSSSQSFALPFQTKRHSLC